MFDKTPATPPADPMRLRSAKTPSTAPSSVGPTILAPNLMFEGRITGSGDLHIDGRFKGEIQVSRLTVGPEGIVEGDVAAEEVEVRGAVTGHIRGGTVRVLASGRVDGDITYQQLALEVGAYFQGRCEQQKPASSIRLVEDARPLDPGD